jgi:hypothetical protein
LTTDQYLGFNHKIRAQVNPKAVLKIDDFKIPIPEGVLEEPSRGASATSDRGHLRLPDCCTSRPSPSCRGESGTYFKSDRLNTIPIGLTCCSVLVFLIASGLKWISSCALDWPSMHSSIKISFCQPGPRNTSRRCSQSTVKVCFSFYTLERVIPPTMSYVRI